MKKFYSLVCLLCLTAMNAMAGIVNVPDVEYTSIEELDGKTFAIVNKAEGKALYGSNNQNLAYSAYADAFLDTNSGYVWKAVQDESGSYYLQLVTPAGNDYNCWGMGGVLNSQGEPQGWACSFILGTNNQKGQDIPNGALYDLVYTAEGWTIKNVGTGMYQPYSNGPANSTEPTYWSFCSLKQVDDGKAPEVYTMPESLKSMIEAGTQFYLKSGDQYLIGGEQQAVAMSDWTAALEGTNSTMWVLTENEDGTGMFRAVTADGSNVSAWGANPCYLNAQPALGGVLFKMNKDQDVKGGSSWIIAEAEGGYTLQCLANKGYATAGVNTSADAVVWELYVPEETAETTIEFILNDSIYALNSHSSVSLEGADAVRVTFGNPAAVASAVYAYYEMVLATDSTGATVWAPAYPTAVRNNLSVSTFGYATLNAKFYQGTHYSIDIIVTYLDGSEETFTCEFDGATPVEEFIPEAEISANGKDLYVDFKVGTDLGDNYTQKPYLKDAAGSTIAISDYYTDNTTGSFFDPLNRVIINLNETLADGTYTLVIPAGTFIVNGGDNNTEWNLEFSVEGGVVTGISALASATGSVKAVFSANGAKLSSMQKGLNIVRLSDGTVKKVMVK